MQKRKNRWYIAVAAVVILAVVLVLAVVLGKKGKNKKDPKMIEPTQRSRHRKYRRKQRKYLIIPLRRPQRQNRFRSPLSASREFSLMWMPERFWLEKMH